MSLDAALSLLSWTIAVVMTLPSWWPGGAPAVFARRGWRIAILVVQIGLTAGAAALAAAAPPVAPPWTWCTVAVAAAAAVLSGGAVTTSVLAVADATSQPTPRVQQTVLRGGAWIGALERLGLLGTVLAGWPDGVLAIVAIKAFARYPELKTGQASGAIERFIIGTFASLGWAGACAGVSTLMLR